MFKSARQWVVGIGVVLFGISPAPAQELRGDLAMFGQVREGDQTRETDAPSYVYGDLAIDRLPHGAEIGTAFQLGRNLAEDDGMSDAYAAYAHLPTPFGLDVTGGRQFLNGGAGGVYVMDGGQARFDRGWPVSFHAFGGVPRYFEPTYSSPLLSRDETVFGGGIGTAQLLGGNFALNYLQSDRADRVLQQLVTATGTRFFPSLPGLPRLYGSVSFDADRQNLDLGTAGMSLLVPQARLQWNVEGTYYDPQDQNESLPVPPPNRREDTIFELFSVGEMEQLRSGLNFTIVKNVSLMLDYSFQHYDHIDDAERENSHVASAGLLWLPGGDGLEVVRLQYYAVDSDGGRLGGGKASYESRVYERILFLTKIDVASYDKVRNDGDVAVSGLIGLGYEFLPGLSCEFDFEANRNDRFDDDFRFGFTIEYNFRQALRRSPAAGSAS